MVLVTRFNPSANGSLHLGHVYTALVNEALATGANGRFAVRWDDSNQFHIQNLGTERMALIVEGQRRDLEWLGFEPVAWVKQSEILEEVHDWLRPRMMLMDDEAPVFLPELIGEDYTPLYPLTPTLTAEKVVMDWQLGVTHLVRGIDLMTEYSMYQYTCRLLKLPQPRHIYLPRLKWQHGDMSKSGTSLEVNELRQSGRTPGQVRDMVAKATLKYAHNGFTLHNLKGEPRL